MGGIDFSSWQGFLTTVIGLALVTLVGVGLRLAAIMALQQRRERVNRQINERLRTLIAAYKALGGSFTGDLSVDPTHLRDMRMADAVPDAREAAGSARARRVRDAVEAALSDIILLGTEEQVRLAGAAARELAAGRRVHTHDLVVSLRGFIREALDLDPVPADAGIPMQGPARPGGGARGGERERGGDGGGGMMGMGMGMAGGDGGRDDPGPRNG